MWPYLAWTVGIALCVLGIFALAKHLERVDPAEPGDLYESEPFGGELR